MTRTQLTICSCPSSQSFESRLIVRFSRLLFKSSKAKIRKDKTPSNTENVVGFDIGVPAVFVNR
jgi:hypothetical protein